ncbi:MAG: TIGR03618 family F420-dependent PPOX class oxidoreductase [Actinobacteria bacterium]|nr:TIGR03618 family F420-dependent PPOX class oxidoreductase [Actinomycetota bacterium]
MMKPLSDDAKRILDDPNFGHLSTLMPDGSPKVDPVWVARDGETILVTSDANSMKVANVEKDSRVALSVIAFDNPYDQLLIRGRVIEVRSDREMVVLDEFSQKYLGKPFGRRKWSERVVLVIRPSVARAYTSPLVDPRLPGS